MCFVLFLAAWVVAQEPAPNDKQPERLQQIRRMYEKLPCEILKITEPVEVTEAHAYRDGGTIGLVLTDASKTQHEFCLDGRSFDEAQAREPKYVYLGATHATHKGARRVQIRGPEEAAIYGVLLRWAQKHPKRDALLGSEEKSEFRRDITFWGTRQFLLRLEARFTELPPKE
jgi:hypothetical protein